MEEEGLLYKNNNARQGRAFAGATGVPAKKDRIDTLMLNRFTEVLQPKPDS